MKIESTDKTVKGVLSQSYYKIPRFQRAFSWEKDQLDEFWSDTISDTESDYFIGSIVVYQEDESHDILGIVDGQQRLTTLQLMFDALHAELVAVGAIAPAMRLETLIVNASPFCSQPSEGAR